MKVEWKTNKIFQDKFINIGNWDFTSCDRFPHEKYISADTETKLYYNDKILQDNEAYLLYKLNGAKWCRCNIRVVPYAFMLSNGENFALFTNIEDFLLCCATMLVDKVFWYNTKFDFAIFDYYFETHEWKTTDYYINGINNRKQKKKFPTNTYQSLNGDFGQRYQMRIWYQYKNKKWNLKVHNFKMVDICNIFSGGLKKNLIAWEIVDKKGIEVRKLTMDYANANVENDIEYLINDTKGLHLLAQKIDKTIEEISGFSLFNGDYITAGGLAKKSLLKFMFKNEKYADNKSDFRFFFPMSVEEDKNYRDLNLYQGGKCLVSPYKIGKKLTNIYKYDINSMYPNQMRNMMYPIGKGKVVEKISNDNDKIYVLKVKNMLGWLKENMIPVYYDTLTHDYVERILQDEEQYFWLEELKELENYYDLVYEIVEILEFKAKQSKGAKDFVDTYYNIKKNSKGVIRNGAKLFLNSAYGKLAERVETTQCDYKLCEEGYIHLVKGETKIDENKIMSVLLGSRITSLARVQLMYYIRKICKDNPKKYFVYCDTDSVHALCSYEDVSDTELGKMKSEGIYQYAKYLAPKTYMLYNNLETNDKHYEVHCKGVNINIVENELLKCKDFDSACEVFKSGVNFKCLTALNCVGGKALIYIDKMLLNPKMEKERIEDDELID